MSLKRKTTALPATSRRSRIHKSRSEREAQANRILLLVAGIIVLVVVVILGGALLVDNVIAPNKAVANTAGQNITVQNYQKRVTYQRWRVGTQLANIQNQVPQQYLSQIFGATTGPYAVYGQMYQQMSEPTAMGKAVLDDMSDQILIEQYAKANNISVNQSDIDKQINDFFGFQPTPMTSTPTVTPSITLTPLVSPTATTTPTITPLPSITLTPTPSPLPTGRPTLTPEATERFKTFQDNQQKFYDDALKATGLTKDDIRQIFTEQALRQKVKDTLTADVAPNNHEDQLKVRHILVDTQDQANDILKAIQNGESFAALAKADSKDTSSGLSGGELGWKGKGTYVPEFEDAIWNSNTKVGDVLGPIKTQFGYHIIQVEGHEVRDITDSDKQTSKDNKFNSFLADLRKKNTIQTYDYITYTPSTPALADFGIQEGLNQQQNGGLGGLGGLGGDSGGGGFPGQ